ncbi:MAG: hypothetical protein U1E05_09450 [Patescibacteria group bacterium]|nr:hypothetical protein [Patescibacteria group bacterium]
MATYTTRIAIVGLLIWCPACFAWEFETCRQQHPWGEFEPGAWKLVRVLTETLDETGLVIGTTTAETRTTLMQADQRGITLQVATTVEVAGKRFEAEPQTLDQGYWGQMDAHALLPGKTSSARLTVGEQSIACQVQEFTLSGPGTRTVSKVFFSDTVKPHVLKRENVTTTLDGSETLGETTTEVIALDLPFRVLSEIQASAHVRSINRYPKGAVFTLAVVSDSVPGGVVSHWSKELDRSGRVVRRSTLELLDYGLEGEPARPGFFGRTRPRKGIVRSPNP